MHSRMPNHQLEAALRHGGDLLHSLHGAPEELHLLGPRPGAAVGRRSPGLLLKNLRYHNRDMY